jgi:biotin synthase
MFEDLGLNIKRQADNGANPRPDNRSGNLEGETPDIVEEFIDNADQAREAGIKVELWDPATQLRYAAKTEVPERPDGAANRWPENHDPEPEAAEALPFGYSAAR